MRLRGRDTASNLVALIAAATAIFAVGGAMRWTQAVVALLTALAVCPLVFSRRVFDRTSPLIALIAIAGGLTALSLIPLPGGLVETFNPTGAALREDGAALLAVDPSSGLSLDAPGSLRALGYFAVLLGIATLSLRMSVSERGRYRVVAAVGTLCGAVAAVVWLHKLFAATQLYGFYELLHAGPHLLGPLLNLNHLACLMAIGVVVAIGLAAYSRQPAWTRVVWVGVAGLCGSVTVASVSRGGTLALGAGAFVTLAALLMQRLMGPDAPRRSRTSILTRALPVGCVAACAVILVIYANAGNVGRKFAETSLDEVSQSNSKFAAWKSGTTLIKESPWVGLGRGAFETSFTRVHAASGAITFSHVENVYLQAVIDWGIPGALALAVVAGWLALAAIRRWRDGPLAAGALGALAVVAVQSNVDFGIELLGLAVPATALAATLTYVPLSEGSARAVAIAKGLRSALVLLLLGCAVLLISRATTSLDEDHVRLRQRDVTLSVVRDSIERHPLDYYGYARASELLVRRGDPRAIRVLNHALRLHPTHPGLHRVAAQMLFHQGHIEQATLEYAAALRASPRPEKLIGEVVALFPIELAAKAIPGDVPELEVVVRALDDIVRPDVAVAWLSRLLDVRPNHARACELLYARSLRAKDLNGTEIARKKCKTVRPDALTQLQIATMLTEERRYDDVIRLLADVEQWTGRVDDTTTAWLVLCDAYIAMSKVSEAKRCLRHLDVSGILRPDRAHEIRDRMDRLDRLERGLDTPAPPVDAGTSSSSDGTTDAAP